MISRCVSTPYPTGCIVLAFLNDMAPKATNIGRWLIGILISMLVLVAVLYWSAPADVIEIIAGLDGDWLVVVGVLALITSVIRFARLWILMPRAQRTPYLYGVISGHAFLNQVLPFRSGELVFPYLLKRATGRPYAVGLTDLLVIRLVELGVLVLFFSSALWLWSTTASPSGDAEIHASSLWGLGIGSTVCLLLGPTLMRQALSALSSILQRAERFERLQALFIHARSALGTLTFRTYIGLVVLTVMMWAVLFALYHAVLLALGVEVSIIETIIGSTGAIIGNLLPVNGIGSIGTMEAGWVAGFVALGKEQSAVMASGLVLHALVIVFLGVTALTALPTPPAHQADSDDP